MTFAGPLRRWVRRRARETPVAVVTGRGIATPSSYAAAAAVGPAAPAVRGRRQDLPFVYVPARTVVADVAWACETAHRVFPSYLPGKIWEDGQGAFEERPMPSEPALLQVVDSLEAAFGTMYAGVPTTQAPYVGGDVLKFWDGAAWQRTTFFSYSNIVKLKWWPAQARLILRDFWDGTDPDYNNGTDPIRAFDGSSTSKIWLGQYAGKLVHAATFGGDLYLLTIAAQDGKARVYRATSVAAAPILLGDFSGIGHDGAGGAVLFHPGTQRLYVAWVETIFAGGTQHIHRSEPLGADPAPTGPLSWTEVYNANSVLGEEIRDGVVFNGEIVWWKLADHLDGIAGLLRSPDGVNWSWLQFGDNTAVVNYWNGQIRILQVTPAPLLLWAGPKTGTGNGIRIYQSFALPSFSVRHGQELDTGSGNRASALAVVPGSLSRPAIPPY